MSQSDQQIQEWIQFIILEQQKPIHDSHSFEDSVEKEVQSVNIIGDTIQKFIEQIQADHDVFYHQCLIYIHGTKYSYGQLVFLIEQEEVTYESFWAERLSTAQYGGDLVTLRNIVALRNVVTLRNVT